MGDRLVPEVRTDRTGRSQTRWVKPDAAPAGKRIPPPQNGGIRGGTGLNSRKEMREPRERLAPGGRPFIASDEEMWRVFAVAHPSVVCNLIASGFKTPAKARKAVEGSLHAQDLSAVAEELIARGVPAGPSVWWLSRVTYDGKVDAMGSPWLADALETYNTKHLSDEGRDSKIPLGILTGEYRFSDLKALGPKTFRSAGPDKTALHRALAEIAAGTTALRAEEIRQLAELLNPTGRKNRTNLLDTAISIARRIGTASPILSSEHPDETVSFISYLGITFIEEHPERVKQAGAWLDEHLLTAPYTDMELSAAMFAAGLTPQGASRGMDEDVEPTVALAMESGIEKGLSSGWL